MVPNKVCLIIGQLALAAVVAVGTNCNDTAQTCTRDSQCPADQACADGVCSPRLKQDSTPVDGQRLDQGADLEPDQLVFSDQAATDGGVMCKANSNGKIERQEMIFSVPSQVKVTKGSGIVLDIQGQGSAGKRLWDLTVAAADDKAEWLKVEAVPTWAASSFKTATYASRLMSNYGFITKTDLMGVFQVKDKALVMVGGVSSTAGHTRFTYDTPLETIRFPVSVGDSYITSSKINGFTVYTVPMWMNEWYRVKVLDRGKVKLLPSFTLDALLVSVEQEAYPVANPLLKTRNHAFIFLAECYGVISRVIVDGDPGTYLQKVKVKERWRLAAP